MKNILVPVDFSDVTEDVIKAAQKIATPFDATIHLLHVVSQPPSYGSVGETAWAATPLALSVEELAAAHASEYQKFENWRSHLEKQGLKVRSHFVADNVTDTILRIAAEHEIDLIIMGSHGHSAFYELIVGTVTETIMRHATCPILVVPANKEARQKKRQEWNVPLATPY